MEKSEKLNVLNLPLDKKILIEASAGTGKTYTIGLIAVRLLLKEEKPLSIERIVLITFTEAATAELRKKTAEKLNDAFLMWENWDKIEKNEKDDLYKIIKDAKESKYSDQKRANLQDAIARIDEMPVFTIHGFCRKLLNEFSFETKNFENKEILPNIGDLEERVIIDFWKSEIEKLDECVIKILPSKFSPAILKIGLNKVKNFPEAVISYKSDISDINEYVKKLNEKFLLLKEEVLKYPESKKEKFINKSNDQINKRDADKNPVFQEYNECVIEFSKIENIIISFLQYILAKRFLEDLQAEKERRKIIDFNDLISCTYKAVLNDNDKILFNAVQKRYDAILVDEFQDTDNMQYKIFDYLFLGKPFYMIGDPKQAIYRFRGGDIYAYLEAKSKLEEKPKTMDKNFRSHKDLITALNTIFNVKNPFDNNDIEYIEVDHGKNLLPLKINNKEKKPFVLLNYEYGINDIKKEDAFYDIEKEVVKEIENLLYYTKSEIYDSDINAYRKIQARDIAILTRTNDQARTYRDALKNSRKKIPAVIRRSNSVFLSDAAGYLMRLLTAFINCQREASIRAALMEFKPITQNDIKPFVTALENWKKSGIMTALNRFFDENFIWSKLYSEDDADRNATNLRQLIELLDKEENEIGKIPERLVKRFSELIEDNKDNKLAEEYEEKLETDDDAIQIMTIHTSKGLQFPVVFVPDITFSAEKPGLKLFEKEPPVYHDNNDINIEYEISNRENIKDFLGDAKAKEQKELLEESARNFYVAVTRAIYRLYLINVFKKEDKTPLSSGQKISLQIKKDENIEVIESYKNLDYNIKKDSSFDSENENLDNEKIFLPKVFTKELKQSWYRSSFTDISYNFEQIEHSEIKRTILKEDEPSGGLRMGLLLHSIFEDINFNSKEKERDALIEKKLNGYKEFTKEKGELKKSWVKEKVSAVLNKNLHSAGKLCDVKDDKRTAELGFYMSSKGMRLDKIKEIMGNRINEFESNELIAQYLKGAIDLVFTGKDGKYYILDWKSNILDKYTKESMEVKAMKPHAYHLQYFIYAVALKRWLSHTVDGFDFKRDFGGVYYIFIRGVAKKEDNYDGIFFIDGKDIIEDIIKMDECFGGNNI